MHSRGYAAKDTQPRLRPRLHSQPCTANVTQPRLCPRLHIHACIAKVTQSRRRSQGYAAKVTQPRLRPRLHCQDYTSPGDIIQVSKHPLFGVARWSHSIFMLDTSKKPTVFEQVFADASGHIRQNQDNHEFFFDLDCITTTTHGRHSCLDVFQDQCISR